MADEKRTALLAQVAHMYYEQSVTQEAIAASLSISRPTVSRLLKEARAEGVVQIIINSPLACVPELEAALGRRFPHLRHVRVLRAADLATVVRAAAAYIDAVVRDGALIGVSWGNTMEALAACLPQRPLTGVTVVQLNGGVARPGAGTNAHEIVGRFSRAFGAEGYYLQVPAVVDDQHVCEALSRNSETARLLELGRRSTVAVYGIGVPDGQSVLVRAGYFTPGYVERLRRNGAVGDICSRYFTEQGAVCDPDLDARTIGLPLTELAHREHAVAVVCGVAKAAGTLGALRGRFMNVLIIDEVTARALLRLEQGGHLHD